MRALLFGILSFLAIASAANAQFISGNRLLELCDTHQATASGYIAGVSDMIITAQQNGLVKTTICFRSGVTAGQTTEIACQYLQAMPSLRDFPANTLVSMALSGAFPCQ